MREDAPAGASPLLDVAAVAELLERESATEARDGDLLERVGDSARRTALFLAERRARAEEQPDRFLAAEQSLVLGHPLHPTPKSREGLTEAEARAYSPELGGSFRLHWLAVDRSVLAQDSAWHEDGAPVPAEQLTARLAGPGLRLPEGTVALPVHPWQIRELRRRPEAAALLDAGALRDLGPSGDPWYPTSSVRTVYRPGAPAMLKLSLGLRITNSRRENLRKELARGAEVHRLLRTGLGARWQGAHPGFDIVRDPAWLAVDGRDGTPVTGLDVMIRDNPFTPDDDVTCVAGLVSPRPAGDARTGGRLGMRSRLGELVTRLAGREGRTRGAVSAEWFARYLQRVVAPVLWLDGHAGIALEAHQQNTLVLLDADGWPTGGRYRDNQGYYFRTSHRDALQARLPGAGEASDTFVADAVTDERFAYYLGINNILGLIGAFGSQRLADERLLLTVLRRFLADQAAPRPRLAAARPAPGLPGPALQGQPPDPPARPGRTGGTGRHPVRLRHDRQPAAHPLVPPPGRSPACPQPPPRPTDPPPPPPGPAPACPRPRPPRGTTARPGRRAPPGRGRPRTSRHRTPPPPGSRRARGRRGTLLDRVGRWAPAATPFGIFRLAPSPPATTSRCSPPG
ncbi:IucA/IucC family protein [Actinomadura keratinilytica]